jgi:ElaB/YqjD/DUF883 family membrane-anchored ribosome-binding protein
VARPHEIALARRLLAYEPIPDSNLEEKAMGTQIPTGDQSRNIQESIKSTIDRGADQAAHLKDAAFERAAHLKDAAMERGRSAFSAIERTIEQRPLAVLGGVFAGGLILGMLLRRR